MAFEIERKFLLAGDAWRTLDGDTAEIRQAYLTSQDKASIRVRIKNNHSATLTIKSRGAELRRLELEYPIPVLEAEAMLALRIGAVIEKVRKRVPIGKHVWEIDVFAGENEGLVIAEIELASEHEHFDKPSWIGVEVTGQAQYYNSALTTRPFKTWPATNSGARIAAP